MQPQTLRSEDDEEIRVLKLALSEYRHVYDHVAKGYDQLRIKALAMLAGEVALGTFIFSSSTLIVPREYYGKVFFFSGIFFLLASLGIILSTLRSMDWKIPSDPDDVQALKTKFSTEKDYLKFIVDDYLMCIHFCKNLSEKRVGRFNWAIIALSVSAIMLLVIKFGGV